MHFVYRLVEVTVISLGLHGTFSFQLCLAAGLQERETEEEDCSYSSNYSFNTLDHNLPWGA